MLLANPMPDVRSPLGQIQAIQRLNREWRPYLSTSELSLVSYLLDNTICWRRDTLRATLAQMVDGIPAWLPRVGLSLSTLERTMAALVARGAVVIGPVKGRRIYTYRVNMGWEPEMSRIATPKRLQGKAQDQTLDIFGSPLNVSMPVILTNLDPQNDGPKYHKANTISPIGGSVQKSLEEGVFGDAPPYPAPATVRVRVRVRPAGAGALDHPADGPTAFPGQSCPPTTVAAVVAKLAPPAPTKAAANKATGATNDTRWRQSWEVAFPGTPCKPFGAKERHIMVELRKRAEAQKIDWLDFLGFCVTEWRMILRTQFAWMKQKAPPQFPEVGFIIAKPFYPKFLEAYAKHVQKLELEAATGDTGELKRLMAEGLSRDEALKEVGRRHAVVDAREGVEKARKHMETTLRALERERAALVSQRLQTERVIPEAPPPGQPVRLIHRDRLDHGDNPYEHPERAPNLEEMLAAVPAWEEEAEVEPCS